MHAQEGYSYVCAISAIAPKKGHRKNQHPMRMKGKYYIHLRKVCTVVVEKPNGGTRC